MSRFFLTQWRRILWLSGNCIVERVLFASISIWLGLSCNITAEAYTYTLDSALDRIETHGPASRLFVPQERQMALGIDGAQALNRSEWNLSMTTGAYRQLDRIGLEDPSLPSRYSDLEKELFDNDFTTPRLSGTVGFSKPLYDGGYRGSLLQKQKAQYKVGHFRYLSIIQDQRQKFIELYFNYQTLNAQYHLLQFKRDNLSKLLTDKAPDQFNKNVSQELLFKKQVLDYEESLFLLEEVLYQREVVKWQLLELMGYQPDDDVTLTPVVSGKVVSMDAKAVSPQEHMLEAKYDSLQGELGLLQSKKRWKIQWKGYYTNNVLSTQIFGSELQMMFPLRQNGVVTSQQETVRSEMMRVKEEQKQMHMTQLMKRRQLKRKIDQMDRQLTLNDRRRELANREWGLKEASFKQGLSAFEDAFESELIYRKALFLFKKVKFQYLSLVYRYNDLVSVK